MRVPFESENPVRYACFLVAAIVAAGIRLSLPTVTGTLSVNFVFVLIGLMSYSAYLWHQPLYALSRMQGLTEAGWPAYAALIADAVSNLKD